MIQPEGVLYFGEKGRSIPPFCLWFEGKPIEVSYLDAPRSRRGKLVDGGEHGFALDGCSFIRERRIVLASYLRDKKAEHDRVLLHELFHFVWVRLGNPARREYERIIRAEYQAGVGGELGWPSLEAKTRLRTGPKDRNDPLWRDYLCESFCDSAAWLMLERPRSNNVTLPPRSRQPRVRWLERLFQSNAIHL